MNRFTMLFTAALLLLLSGLLAAQTVNVTFRLNTATVPDTVGEKALVQVRGGVAPLTWDNSTEGQFVNTGGDYWEVTLPLPVNTLVPYKFWVNAQGTPEGDHGWESNPNTGSGNRELTTTESDTVLPVKFFNKVTGSGQDDLPYEPSDSIDVWFRVNVQRPSQFQGFNPETQVAGVRGGVASLDWGKTIVLTPETPSDNQGQFGYPAEYFWSSQVKIDPNAVSSGQTVAYKFVFGPVDDVDNTGSPLFAWESTPDRIWTLGSGADTTIVWDWWQSEKPPTTTGTDTVTAKFTADLTRAIEDNGFNLGDTVEVQWGFFGEAVFGRDTLTNVFLTQKYESADVEVANVTLGSQLLYQYYIIKNGIPQREIFYDFDNVSGDVRAAERRKLDIPPSPPAVIEVVDDEVSTTSMRRQPRFQNNLPVPENVWATFEVNLSPAYYQALAGDTLDDIQGDVDIFPSLADSVIPWGVWINGPAAGGWSNPPGTDWGLDLRNNEDKKMWDDGENGGDMTAGDSVYSATYFYSPDSSGDVIGQVFKFGVYGGDNEGGKGGFGNNHVANIPAKDAGGDTVTVHAQFGSINPPFYSAWDYDNERPAGPVGIGDELDYRVAKTPALDQNYPNPFNPTTSIRFTLPAAREVKLVIYNSLGQKVATLLDGRQRAGVHIVEWNARDDRGRPVSSGIYFYRLTSDNYDKSLKMLLLK